LQNRVEGISEGIRFDSLAIGAPGDRVIVEITVRRTGERSQSVGIVSDSMPAGATVIPSSITKVAGVDSVWMRGGTVMAKINGGDSVAVFSYTVDISQNAEQAASGHSIELIRTSAGGKEFVNRYTLPLVRVK
jgi:hypothetical protein